MRFQRRFFVVNWCHVFKSCKDLIMIWSFCHKKLQTFCICHYNYLLLRLYFSMYCLVDFCMPFGLFFCHGFFWFFGLVSWNVPLVFVAFIFLVFDITECKLSLDKCLSLICGYWLLSNLSTKCIYHYFSSINWSFVDICYDISLHLYWWARQI